MTDLLGSPPPETIARIRNEKARRYLSSMRRKKPIPLIDKFPNADPFALRLLERMLAFDPKDRPSAEEAFADPYFRNLARVEREPSAQPVAKMDFEFERRRITKEDVRELIYRETLEYHPKMLKEFIEGAEPTGFMYPSAVDKFKKQFAYLEEHYGNGAAAPPERQHSSSLPRPCVLYSDKNQVDLTSAHSITRFPGHVPPNIQGVAARPGKVIGPVVRYNNCGAAAASIEANEQHKMVRNPSVNAQYIVPGSSYPRKHPGCKNEKGDNSSEGSNGLQPKPDLYMARKVAAAQDGAVNHWY